MTIRFAKGHGTENDFVLLPDPDGELDLDVTLVRALCDRRAGLGGDGVLRVVRRDGTWFMDYRNADGSIAEMCGNGVRVFARYLVHAGLAEPGTLPIGSRAGVKTVTVPAEGDVVVDMGPPVFTGESVATLAGTPYAGVAVSMGNPHLVCGTTTPVGDLDLSGAPEVDAVTFPDGVNVELVNVLDPVPGTDLHVRMRVHERGVGETRSCGTGASAVGAVALRSAGRDVGTVTVDVPGGRVVVTVTPGTSLLAGPAVIVAEGILDPAWLAAARAAAEVPA